MLKNKYEAFAANAEYANRIHEREYEHKIRDKFERDRDRILYSKSFRRLSGKTQVFVDGFDDHVRTRLTHTLEVAQITRTICRELGLNEILGEAIALGHDIGHTPFGHIGERTLNYIMNGCDNVKTINENLDSRDKGFKHNLQSLKVVMELEQISNDYDGLNLTDNTLWGILNHSKLEYGECNKRIKGISKCSLRQSFEECKGFDDASSVDYYKKYIDEIPLEAWTIEALIVRQADEIAQRHHDIEDALEANIIDKKELEEKLENCFGDWISEEKNWSEIMDKIKAENNKTYYLSMFSKLIVDFLTTNLINNIKKVLYELKKDYGIEKNSDFYKSKFEIRNDFELKGKTLFDVFDYSEELKEKDEEFKRYLSNRILNSFLAQSMDGKSNFLIRQLIKAYVTNPQQLPDKTIYTLYNNYMSKDEWEYYENISIKGSYKKAVGELRNKLNKDHFNILDDGYKRVLLRTVCDYIAGMTDMYAIEQYTLLYGSKHIGQM